MTTRDIEPREIPRFDRHFVDGAHRFARIGDGSLGGKAEGLIFIERFLAAKVDAGVAASIAVGIPKTAVIATDHFDAFMIENDLYGIALSGQADAVIARAFQRADLPARLVGDLRALVGQVHEPLAIRSSSLLEDTLHEPFAGVYATKMIPNNQFDPDLRWRKLVEAVKFVYASTFFAEAASYVRATRRTSRDEKMAVIVQEVVGRRHRDRFYPDVSGVARSHNFYPSGHARPDEGVVNLALGLGKTIVDGGLSWIYSPAWPKAPPPYGSAAEIVRNTQSEFWAVNMGASPAYDPTEETEYLVRCGLPDAEEDGTLRWGASTYDPSSDRIVFGIAAQGPRVLDFASLLAFDDWPFNAVLRRLIDVAKEALDEDVEIEFAVTFPERRGAPARFGFLQVRPMAVSHQKVEVGPDDMRDELVLVASGRVMGNGVDETIADIVYVKPEAFAAEHTRAIAAELETFNRALVDACRPYLLIGFGRWGSADPWLGVPVAWAEISGARAIVESTLPDMRVEPSQGSHFFHNISSFRIPYFTIAHDLDRPIAWERLAARPTVAESRFVRHVSLEASLVVKVDGRTGRGVIVMRDRPEAEEARS